MSKKLSHDKSSRQRSPKEGLGRYRQEQRQKELSDLVSQGIWELSQDDKKFPAGLIVTVTRVVAGPEVASANIFCRFYPDEARAAAITYLNKKAPFLRHFVATKVAFRLSPKIHFIYDKESAEGDHILSLLDSLKK